MAKTTNPEGNITYKLAGDENELTSEDKEKILKLAKKIEKGKDIAEKFKKPSYDIRKILTTKIVREHEGRKETFTLLHHAMLHDNEKAINDIFEKAKEHQLFEEISNEPMISEYLDGEGKLTSHSSTVEYKNGVVSIKTFKTQEIDTNAGITTTYTKSRRSDKNSFNNENCDDTRKHPVCESSKKDTATLTETATQKLSILTDKTNTSPFTETENQTETRSYSEPAKENTVHKKPLTKATQQRQAPRVGSIGAVLLVVSSVVSYMLEMLVIAVIGGIMGLVCIGFALYNVIKPSTKLEEVENIKKYSPKLPIITP